MSNLASVNVGDTPPVIASHPHADTYNWNSAFAINFTNANTAIANNWPSVNNSAKNITQAASDDPSYNLNGVFGPWQLTMGGDGKNVRLACPLASGTYHAGGKTYDLKGAGVIIEVGMEWVPNPDQFAFVISGNTLVDGIKADLNNNSIDANLKAAFTAKGVTLSAAAAATVQKQGLEWWIVDGKNNYYLFYLADKDNNEFINVYQFQSAWKNNLNILSKEVGDNEPAVNVITITNNPSSGIPADVLPGLFSDWFNNNIGNFNYVFAALDLSPALSQSDKYKWIKPTSTSYAVTDMGTMDSSIFGVLTMALDNQPGDNHQVSPNAIPAGKDANGANAGFLISGTMFMQQMMLPGACAIFNGADPSSFLITNDGLTVQNTADIVFGKFMMDNKNQGSVQTSNYPASLDAGTIPQGLIDDLNNNLNIYIDSSYKAQVTTKGSQWLLTQGQSNGGDEYILTIDSTDNTKIDVFLATVMTIPKGQFKMSLVESYVEIEFIDISYPYSSDFDVHVNYTEQVELTLQQKNGKNIFWYNQILKDMTVTATKTKSAITREIVEGAVTGALALIAVLGPIVEGLSASAEIGEVTEDGGTAIIDEESFVESEVKNPEETEENNVDAGKNAANTSKGRLTNIKNAFNTPKWKFVGALAGLAGAVAGFDQAIDAIIENAANNKWENVPGFDDFANQVIEPYSWPGVNGYTLKSAWLAGSLQIGLQTN